MDAITCIQTRKSVRKFTEQQIPNEMIMKILECGRWTPSGVNYQPWKVIVVSDNSVKKMLANCTRFGKIILQASHNFVIYLDLSSGYNYTKSVQSIGAFCQNILLAVHALGLGGVWLGEPYNQKEQIDNLLNITSLGDDLEFQAILACGYPSDEEKKRSKRKSVEDFVIWK